MITTNIHIHDEDGFRPAHIDTARGDGNATVVQTIGPWPSGSNVTLFLSPQVAVELGHALVQAGIRAQQIIDVAAATKAALEDA